jgi:hypothetical protein
MFFSLRSLNSLYASKHLEVLKGRVWPLVTRHALAISLDLSAFVQSEGLEQFVLKFSPARRFKIMPRTRTEDGSELVFADA